VKRVNDSPVGLGGACALRLALSPVGPSRPILAGGSRLARCSGTLPVPPLSTASCLGRGWRTVMCCGTGPLYSGTWRQMVLRWPIGGDWWRVAGSVWGHDTAAATAVGSALQCGSVWIKIFAVMFVNSFFQMAALAISTASLAHIDPSIAMGAWCARWAMMYTVKLARRDLGAVAACEWRSGSVRKLVPLECHRHGDSDMTVNLSVLKGGRPAAVPPSLELVCTVLQ
jgi:hypothetical protein